MLDNNNKLPTTWEELKERFENAPKPSGTSKTICLCGHHIEPEPLTDEDYKYMFKILTEGYTPMH